MAANGSVRVRLLAPLQLDRLGDLPEHDPDHGHRLAGDEVLVVERGTLTVPLRQELVLARLALRRSPTLIGGAPDRAPSGAQEQPAGAGSIRYRERSHSRYRSLACLLPSPRVRIPYAPFTF
jgi:hypothetical protein